MFFPNRRNWWNFETWYSTRNYEPLSSPKFENEVNFLIFFDRSLLTKSTKNGRSDFSPGFQCPAKLAYFSSQQFRVLGSWIFVNYFFPVLSLWSFSGAHDFVYLVSTCFFPTVPLFHFFLFSICIIFFWTVNNKTSWRMIDWSLTFQIFQQNSMLIWGVVVGRNIPNFPNLPYMPVSAKFFLPA